VLLTGKLNHTSKLSPVTEPKEVAMEAPERASSPRWPTNMTDITSNMNYITFAIIRGPASVSCFFISHTTLSVSIAPLSLCGSLLSCFLSEGKGTK